jgi:cytochrome c nitrite reductase small subunit
MTHNETGARARPRISWWMVSFAGLFGVLVGLGFFTFGFARGASYFSDNPETCMNCHIMRDQFEAWRHSSHARVATCNDCHTPHDFVNKWIIKGVNGWNHSVAFTLGNFHEPIRIRDFNADVVQQSCVYCHQNIVSVLDGPHATEPTQCIACHSSVGHPNRQ